MLLLLLLMMMLINVTLKLMFVVFSARRSASRDDADAF